MPTSTALATRLQSGQSCNPEGSRAKCRFRLSEAFVRALWLDFERHGAEAIVKVRERRPRDYLKIIASLDPRRVVEEEEDEESIVIGALVLRGIND